MTSGLVKSTKISCLKAMGHRLYPCSKNSRGRDGDQIKGIDEAQLISDSEIARLLLLLSAFTYWPEIRKGSDRRVQILDNTRQSKSGTKPLIVAINGPYLYCPV